MKPRHSSIPGTEKNILTACYSLAPVKVIIVTEKSCETCPNCQINEKGCPEHSANWNNKYLHEYDSAATLKCTENQCYCSNGNTQVIFFYVQHSNYTNYTIKIENSKINLIFFYNRPWIT